MVRKISNFCSWGWFQGSKGRVRGRGLAKDLRKHVFWYRFSEQATWIPAYQGGGDQKLGILNEHTILNVLYVSRSNVFFLLSLRLEIVASLFLWCWKILCSCRFLLFDVFPPYFVGIIDVQCQSYCLCYSFAPRYIWRG